jgi:hypothetical protein
MRQKNPYLKPANEVLEYTSQQVREIARCSHDVEYFIRTYCQIQHPVKGTIPFALRPYQQRMVGTFAENRLSIALAPRQIGKSWIAGAFLLWFASFHFEKTVLILSNKNDNAMEMIHRVRFIYEHLPRWLKPGLTADGWNKHSVSFDNNSRILSQATSVDSGRGLSVSLLFCDEFAFVRDSIAEEFWTSISPTLATGGNCIICSTPNGDMNRFAELWRGATTPSLLDPKVGINGFAAVSVTWDEPPDRDEKFKETEIAKIGLTRWEQEYECKFISNDTQLFDGMVLANMWATVKDNQPLFVKHDTKWYKPVGHNKTYLVGMDVATGSGSDFTTIEVFEFPSMEQVAEYRTNDLRPSACYKTLKRVLAELEIGNNMVYFTVENNGVGESIITLLEVDEDPPQTSEFVSDEGAKRRGMVTTQRNKIKTSLALKELLQRRAIKVHSPVLVTEMRMYVRSRGSYAAKPGGTDDLVAATLLILRLVEEMTTYDDAAYKALYGSAMTSITTDPDEYDYNEVPMPIVFG